MLDYDQLEDTVRELIVDLCEVLYHRGYREVPVGAMMRLVGVNNSKASEHDNEYFALDEDFIAVIESRKTTTPTKAPTGVTLH